MIKFFKKSLFLDTLYVTLGSLLLAISINCILLPNKIIVGGASGICIILNYLFNINVSIILYAINVPLLVICFLLLGKSIGIKTVYGSLLYPFFVELTSSLPILTHNLFLATVFGGLLLGISLGLVFIGNASTGGTTIITQIINKYGHISLGLAIFLVDGAIIVFALYVFDIDIILFSLICLCIIGRVVNLMEGGISQSKNVIIISSNYLEIKNNVLFNLKKGVTMIPIERGFHGKDEMLLMSVISSRDFIKMRDSVLAIDKQAFIISMNANEVYGRGFNLIRLT